MTTRKTWTTTVEDAGDGSGDCLIKFPKEVTDLLGWKPGDVIKLKVKDGKLYLTKKKMRKAKR